jgi:hypothetical protein
MSPSPRSQPRPRNAAKPIDDFEWPPTADDVSVYEVGPAPWPTRQDPPGRNVVVRQRERSQPHREPAASRPTGVKQKLAAVGAASAIVAAAAGCVLYASMAHPAPVRAIHHPAPPAAVIPPPPPLTIVATYPVEPAPSNEAPVSHDAATGGDTAAAAPLVDSGDAPRMALDAAPVDAPAAEETSRSGSSEVAAPPSESAAAPSSEPVAADPSPVSPAPGPTADPGPVTPDSGTRSAH